jgi:4-hydroxy-tetrahydrodipicolinate synthase
VAGRAVVMAATAGWWTGQAVDYARFAESVGADAVQVTLPDRGDEDSLFRHIRAVTAATRLPLGLHGQPSLSLMRRLLTLDPVVAFKEEFTTTYTLPFYKEFGDRLNIFAGGEKARLLTYWPYGMRGYYSTFITFHPPVAVRFWKAVQAGDLKEAGKVVLRYDVPFFEKWTHPFWRATLEYFGVAQRWVRPPDVSFTNAQMKEVKAFYEGLGLAPGG